jgi:hypothetical protein
VPNGQNEGLLIEALGEDSICVIEDTTYVKWTLLEEIDNKPVRI